MNEKALIKDLNEVYNLVADDDITEAMERLEFVISEIKQLHIPVVTQQRELLLDFLTKHDKSLTERDRIEYVDEYIDYKSNNCG